ncbi:MAG: hypothetical protein NTY07_09135 [Bacteroidia bacterium]|nr:hypothetical protein [Bacteroidia bacterium]
MNEHEVQIISCRYHYQD